MTTGSIAISLIQNASVLLCFVLLYDYFLVKIVTYRLFQKVLSGIIISVIGILLMSTPWSLSPGVFFDTRSILLSISGLFIGLVPTFLAMIVLGIYRIYLGGDGVWMGIATILTSGIIGILWGKLWPDIQHAKNKAFKLILFGCVVHLMFLLCSLFMPKELIVSTLRELVVPVLLLYIPGTMIMGLIMIRRAENWQAKSLLIESKSLYSSLVNHMPAGVFRKTADGRYDYVNDRFCALKGMTEQEIIGKNPKELADYEEQKFTAGKYTKPPVQRTLVTQGTDHHEWIMRHGMPIIVEEAYPHKDGHSEYFQVVKTPIFNSFGQVIGSQGMQFDITTSKRNQEALIYEQYLLKSFMDNTPDSIFFKDLESRFIRINKAQSLVLGVSDEQEVIGKTDFDYFSIDHAKIAFEDEQTIIRTGKSLINKEEKASWHDGHTVWFNTSKFPFKDKDGKIVGTFGVSKNITPQKNLEADLLAAKIKAEESDHLKTAFLHNISHEIRTPMNAIVGFSGFLSDPEIDMEKKAHFANVVVQSSNQLMKIIDDIVLIATIEAGQENINESEIQLNSLLRFEYEQFITKAIEKGLDFKFKPGLGNSQSGIMADETKLLQVISNLLVNAFKFTSKGHVYFGYTLKNDLLEFFVEDTGIGISKEMHKEIFQRFRQVDSSMSRQYGGSGLGLSISKAYIDLMGGNMWVESEQGNGSRFYFTLPYRRTTEPESIKPTTSEIVAVQNENKKLSILIAEDEDLNFLLIKELLRPFKFRIIRAINGAEAVGIASEDESVELVLMDLKMPVMDGFEATKLIKQLRPSLTVIALTAYSMESDKIKAISSGCSDVIVKPIQKENLYAKLKGFITV